MTITKEELIKAAETLIEFCCSQKYCGSCPANKICSYYLDMYEMELID